MMKMHQLWTPLILAASLCQAAINIDTVMVADASNPSDISGDGTVTYDYHIGTYEVTNSQYVAFLNDVAETDTHGLYASEMSTDIYGGINRSGTSGSFTYAAKSGFENKPVGFVSFWDAARFANWLSTGDTETGVYILTDEEINNNSIARDPTAWAAGGVALANRNEWYKAAYYSGSSTGADGDGYWLYPTQSNSITISDANYGDFVNADPVDIGSYPNASSYYGTFDQGGNSIEWNETIVGGDRLARGGGPRSSAGDLESGGFRTFDPLLEASDLGFRVTSLAPIPEPSSYAAILGMLAFASVVIRRRLS